MHGYTLVLHYPVLLYLYHVLTLPLQSHLHGLGLFYRGLLLSLSCPGPGHTPSLAGPDPVLTMSIICPAPALSFSGPVPALTRRDPTRPAPPCPVLFCPVLPYVHPVLP